MAGTQPTFYKVPVTEHLSMAVNKAWFLHQATVDKKVFNITVPSKLLPSPSDK
ncbi:hypothetical protein AX16_001869 [Volvariella volvacea WC 439]|nr:hypothetical protein AX16_001869 [Volvariella volvacea WC 439]